MRRWRVPAAGVGAALVLLVIYFVGVHQPRRDRIAGLVEDANQLRLQQVPLQRDIKGLEQVAARETELSSALRHLERLIPSELAQPTLLAQLQTAAEGAEVELVSITFDEPAVPKGAPVSHLPGTVLVAMPVTVIVAGPYLGITDLLHRVEVDVDRALLVGTIALTEAEAGFPMLTGTWSGQAYALLPADDPLLVDPDSPTAAPPPSAEPAPANT